MSVSLLNFPIELTGDVEIYHICEIVLFWVDIITTPNYYPHLKLMICCWTDIELLNLPNTYLIEIDLSDWHKIHPESKFALLLSRLPDLQIVCLYRVVEFYLAKLRKDPIFSMDNCLADQLIEQPDKVSIVDLDLNLAIFREG